MRRNIHFIPRLSISRFLPALVLGFTAVMASHGQPSIKSSSTEFTPLQAFAGRYQASPETMITVRQHGDRLALEVNLGWPMEFSAESDDRFLHEQSGTRISFVRDDQGKVTHLVLHRGGDRRAERISDIPASEQVRTVDVNGTTFRTVISGNGRPSVVLVSGLDNWAKVAAGIESEVRVVRYGTDGGRAPKGGPADVRAQARMLHELLGTLEIARPCILVGHSFGGALTRIYAELYPGDVGGMVLVDPFHEGWVDWLKTNQPANYELIHQQISGRYVSDWDDFLARLRGSRVLEGIPVVLLTAGNRQIRTGNVLETQVKAADFEAGTAAVMEAHKAWIRTISNGRHVIVPNAGHDIPSEGPSFVIEAIKQTGKQLKEGNK